MIINGKDHREILEKIIKHYGPEHQRIKACEELAELQVELHHNSRHGVLEEMADVYIMLEQVKKIYKIQKNELTDMMEAKLQRTERLINDN